MDRFSFLNAVHAAFVEDLYEQYLSHPDSVSDSWRSFFQGYDFARTSYNGHEEGGIEAVQEHISSVSPEVSQEVLKEFDVINLINAYRSRGHLFTKTNPVRERRTYKPDLDVSHFNLAESDLDKKFSAGNILGIGGPATLRDIIEHLKLIYCDSIGIEYMYIRDPEQVQWIQHWINDNLNHPKLTKDEKHHILYKLNQAVGFENFLHRKFVGQKRFSLEGNESLIPAMDELIERSVDHGVMEFVVGMAHRGRLNVLANIFGKPYKQVFSEFDDKDFEGDLYFAGDVKYHLGANATVKTEKGVQIKMNLAPNPSHLEAVDPVVEGIARAKVDLDYNGDFQKVMPILIHGDAAIAGQGVVYEVVQMMNLDGYKTGGTIHIVINNQIGFTTNYLDGRSSTYCTDVGKATLSPVLHVNADDVEAVVHALRFAADFRARWGRDVFIDLLGYRKYGHNEGDEPRFTQPKLYDIIAKHPNPRDMYKKVLLDKAELTEELAIKMEEELKQELETSFEESKKIELNVLEEFMPDEWKGFHGKIPQNGIFDIDTSFDESKLRQIVETLTTLPEDKNFLRKIQRLIKQRRQMVEEGEIDWGMAELMAYGSLLMEGYDVRISGEDVERGTFSHRHAVIKTEEAEKEYLLLNQIHQDQGTFQIYNSLLSEYAVLGFDYGYALAAPKTLTIWEAQFGDFANGAQIITDQYISAAEDKWLIQNGLVMLLPHGYEGQGAEHSSARLERFLTLCAENNITVANCTTPANFFHLLRRQMKTDFRKPLVVMTPKSLLRHPMVTATLEDLSAGQFHRIIPDTESNHKGVKRVVLCSGKFYYDLLKRRQEIDNKTVALVRLEQLYPLDIQGVEDLLKNYPKNTEFVWAQEEPENMGAWGFILRRLRHLNPQCIAQPESASPAAGSHHRAEVIHENIIKQVFDI